MRGVSVALFMLALALPAANGFESVRADDPDEVLGSPEQLVLTLDPVKTTFALHEPVVLRYRVTNPTKNPILSAVQMSYDAGLIFIDIASDTSRPMPFHTGPFFDSTGFIRTRHEPGEIMESDVVVFFNDSKGAEAFPRAGRFSIQARMRVGPPAVSPQMIASLPVSIEIVEPSWSDRQLTESLGSSDDLVKLLREGPGRACAGDRETECIDNLLHLAEKYALSAYAPFIARDLGNLTTFKGKKNPKLYGTAVDRLTRFGDLWPDHALSADVSYDRIWALNRAGRMKDLIEAMDDYADRFPQRAHSIRPLREQVRPDKPASEQEP